ncbi:MAG: D-glycero-beta-D-manno-heptose 1,7-bisphosphate 7-phosphatase [Chloroflexota bacterium]|nr:D-glycero-beta-D-manno-heptose 1,7-bisphosphate 7-phosphatase [Chloroflexota bacterium]
MESVTSAVFLDRDGTINRDVNYLRRVHDLEILPKVPQAINLLNRCGFKVIIVTNQSGVARGYFTHSTLNDIHTAIKHQLAQYDAFIDDIYYCPHHPNDGCSCRKPNTGLFLQAARDHAINLSTSCVVGDKHTDIAAGNALKSRAVLVTTGPTASQEKGTSADFVAATLLDAAEWIVHKNR